MSVYGTVLHELAYFKIVPICAGNSPYKNYGFVFTPKNKKDYFKKIDLALNKKLYLPKNYKSQIAEYYYMWYLNNNDSIRNFSRILNLKKYKSKVPENNIFALKNFNNGIFEKKLINQKDLK